MRKNGAAKSALERNINFSFKVKNKRGKKNKKFQNYQKKSTSSDLKQILVEQTEKVVHGRF